MRIKKISLDSIWGGCVLLTIIMNNVFGSDPILFQLSKLTTLVFFIVSIFNVLKNQQIIISKCLMIPFLFFICETVSVLWASNRNAATMQYMTQLQLFILFLFIFLYSSQNRGDISAFLNATYYSGFALAVYALYKYGLSGYLSLMNAGERMGGTIANQNTFGMVFSSALLIAFFNLVETKNIKNVLGIIIFGFFALSSGSKKAIFIIVVGIVLISIFKYGIRNLWKVLLLVIILSVVIYYVLQLPLFGTINERLTAFLLGENSISDLNRRKFIARGIELFFAKPFLGYGLNNYASISGYGVYSHNNYIELLVSLGLVGSILFYFPMIASATRCIRRIRSNKDRNALIILVFIAVNIIFGYGMVQFYEKDCWIFYGFMLAFAYESSGRYKTREQQFD